MLKKVSLAVLLLTVTHPSCTSVKQSTAPHCTWGVIPPGDHQECGTCMARVVMSVLLHCSNFQKLSPNMKKRLAVENDDKASQWSITDLLPLHDRIGMLLLVERVRP